MGLFFPTTTMTVERSVVAQDGWGDDTHTWAPIDGGTRVSAAYAERRKHVYDPASGRAGTVTWGEALLPVHLEVVEGDRLLDHTSGEYHHITHVQRPQNIAFPGSMLRVETNDPDG